MTISAGAWIARLLRQAQAATAACPPPCAAQPAWRARRSQPASVQAGRGGSAARSAPAARQPHVTTRVCRLRASAGQSSASGSPASARRCLGDAEHARSVVPVRQWDPGGGRGALGGADAGDDLERNAGLGQRLGFLAAAAEGVGIAALEAQHRRPLRARRSISSMIASCGSAWCAHSCRRRRGRPRGQQQDLPRDQLVVEHQARRGDGARRLDREQFGVAGPAPTSVTLDGHGRRPRRWC